MNLTWLDWGIVVVVFAALVAGVSLSRIYMRSVADFLAAGRTAGRYLVCVAGGVAALGDITIVANFEMNYQAGFAMTWWSFTNAVVVFIISITGWVVYRFRQTRAMTMAQFFERRYSRNFRVFAGIIAFLSGIINFGIFPAVGARFFIYFCGLPPAFSFLGFEISTFAFTMIVLLVMALYFVFTGGQIAVMITSFMQGVFVNIVFVILIIYLLTAFSFSQIFAGVQMAPAEASLINPFKTSAAKDFNIWYAVIAVIGIVYSTLSWQGTQGYNTSAKSAHEAKMGQVLANWRTIPQNLFWVFVPICAFVLMKHSAFSSQAGQVDAILAGVNGEAIKSQLTVPLAFTQMLPRGLMGAFVAVMLCASISTNDTYLHSWGSIFIQDVILPLRPKPFTPEQHLKVLKWSIVGVAVFIFFFSLLFQQSQYILLFFAITGAIYAGGSGAVIIGGLYWKRGTTAAAWSAMITGSVIAVGGIIIHQIQPGFFINGQIFWGIAMASSVVIYIVVSLLGKKPEVDLDKLLHRGKYVIADEYKIVEHAPQRGWKMLGMGKEFTRSDKAIYIATYGWTFLWSVIFVVGTIYNLTHKVGDLAWMKFWYFFIGVNLVVSVLITAWFTIGGMRDIRAMFAELKTMQRDARDDGRVWEE